MIPPPRDQAAVTNNSTSLALSRRCRWICCLTCDVGERKPADELLSTGDVNCEEASRAMIRQLQGLNGLIEVEVSAIALQPDERAAFALPSARFLYHDNGSPNVRLGNRRSARCKGESRDIKSEAATVMTHPPTLESECYGRLFSNSGEAEHGAAGRLNLRLGTELKEILKL